MKHSILTLVTMLASATPAFAHVQTIDYPTFSDVSAFTFNGNATRQTGTTGSPVIRLTPSRAYKSGAAYLTTPIALDGRQAFETKFQFQIHNGSSTDQWSDGLTFVITATPSEIGASGEAGGNIGYGTDPDSVAVAFDTCAYGNEVGVVTNGDLSTLGTVSSAWGYQYGLKGSCGVNGPQPTGWLADGDIWTADIRYDGTFFNIRVEDGTSGISKVVSDYQLKISTALGSGPIYVGFTAGTGLGYADYDILDWKMVY